MAVNNYKLTTVATLDFYTEGPVLDAQGNLYFTDLKGGTIYQYTRERRVVKWAHSPCPNGQYILPNGDHVICDVETSSIKRFNSSGKFREDLITGYCAGVKLFCPNDIVADDNETIYFTDSIRYNGKVFSKRQREEKVVAENLDYPNGLVCSHDRQWLFVAESFQNRILKVCLSTGQINVFCTLPQNSSERNEDNLPDGLALDDEGNIWVAHHGMQAIHQISPEGRLLGSIDTTFRLASNVTSSGKILFVTGGQGEPGPGQVIKIELQ